MMRVDVRDGGILSTRIQGRNGPFIYLSVPAQNCPELPERAKTNDGTTVELHRPTCWNYVRLTRQRSGRGDKEEGGRDKFQLRDGSEETRKREKERGITLPITSEPPAVLEANQKLVFSALWESSETGRLHVE